MLNLLKNILNFLKKKYTKFVEIEKYIEFTEIKYKYIKLIKTSIESNQNY